MRWLQNFKHVCWSIMFARKTTKKFDHSNDKLFLVSTGPSAEEFWNNSEFRNQFLGYDICLLNDCFFGYVEQVFKLRPKYFCLMDVAYFDDKVEGDSDQIDRLSIINNNLKLLKEVNWPLTMIIPSGKSLEIFNPNIDFIYLNASVCDKKNKFKYYLYDKNIMNPCNNTVTHSAIYYGIMSGYKTIGFIGSECNYVKNIEIDRDGKIILIIPHSFEESEIMRRWTLNEIPMYQCEEGIVAAFLKRQSETIGGYMYLRDYADYRGVEIINYSKGTIIDAFKIGNY